MGVLKEGQRLGVYRIVRLLGEGGMGAVYEARQGPLDRRVALKTLHADHAKNTESITRFFNEAKVLSRLEHPSIVQVSDFGQAEDGTTFLVMEYLRGQSLAHRVSELSACGEVLPIVTALQVCVQVADVLGMAHAQGIVHRDMKPANLMLVADPVAPGGERVKVLDFGIAKLTDDSGGMKTATNQVLGTPAYMSPEQCAGAGRVDAQTDVYALGCVLYELLSGMTPFVAEGAGQLIGMHLFQEPPLLTLVAPHVPSEIADLVHWMLRKEKAQRPTMKEAGTELLKHLAKLPGGAMGVAPPPQKRGEPNGKTESPQGVPASSTGGSIGQSIRQGLHGSEEKKRRKGIWAGISVAFLGIGLLVVKWVSMGSTEMSQRTVPVNVSSLSKVPLQNPERPDLGMTQTRPASDFANGGSKPEEKPKPVAKQNGKNAETTSREPKGQAPIDERNPRKESRDRAGKKTPQQNGFGYEE